jgi:hypothetical protein
MFSILTTRSTRALNILMWKDEESIFFKVFDPMSDGCRLFHIVIDFSPIFSAICKIRIKRQNEDHLDASTKKLRRKVARKIVSFDKGDCILNFYSLIKLKKKLGRMNEVRCFVSIFDVVVSIVLLFILSQY